jgi:alcohol dehydrogenase class IV
MKPFSIARLPRIEFGSGTAGQLGRIAAAYGKRALIVTGARSLVTSERWPAIQGLLAEAKVDVDHEVIDGEPSPELIDQIVQRYPSGRIQVVIGIGGGSAVDAAKAIAGLLEVRRSVMDFLEGVGPELPYEGPAVPLIAVPTTAGTGSEATKNAVLSRQGPDGFKKSFRHERLVPEYAIVDPDLLKSCPPEVIAANGMDALTQLIESYVSLRSNAFTDALVWSGLEAARDGLLSWYEQGPAAHEAQARMSFAALVSGVALAQTGLGSVHGLASPLGAHHPIAHGVACGTLVAEATRINIEAMVSREPENPALAKYARLAELLCRQRFSHREPAWQALVDLLTEWTERLALPRLGSLGLTPEDVGAVVANSRGSSMRTNPIVLTDAEIQALVEKRL